MWFFIRWRSSDKNETCGKFQLVTESKNVIMLHALRGAAIHIVCSCLVQKWNCDFNCVQHYQRRMCCAINPSCIRDWWLLNVQARVSCSFILQNFFFPASTDYGNYISLRMQIVAVLSQISQSVQFSSHVPCPSGSFFTHCPHMPDN